MYLFGKISVTAILPEKLGKLKDLAYNLWWTWNPQVLDLFAELDPQLWEKLQHNPVTMLQVISRTKLEQKLSDTGFMSRYSTVVQEFEAYMNESKTWFNENYPDSGNHMIAYFSAEFGLTEIIPVYSGGLGVLSGDHCKSASDLGLPFAAVGLFYKQGYFNQHINKEGWQETIYPDLNPSHLPVKRVLDQDGKAASISVEIAGRIVYAEIWEVKIGRISLYLLDTDTEKNSEPDRYLTSRLYGGDQETRIQQEILLGIGGVKTLEFLRLKTTVYHMNEGHSAFAGLELMRRLVQDKHLTFKEAKEVVSSSLVFTTHTPVPAGNDVFPLHMIDKYFNNFWGTLGISRHEFLDFGLKVGDSHNFNMTVLALTLSGRRNGVSELHGAVTRNIFGNLWPGVPEQEVPVSHITNGIHTLTWLSPDLKVLYSKYFEKNWANNIHKPEIWSGLEKVPDNELWEIHCIAKKKMIDHVRKCLKDQEIKNGESLENIREAANMLDPNTLTIGFARRFATYKRAALIFRDAERIKRILNDSRMPVQIIFAGKAHPADRPAHEIIKNIHDIARQEGFKGKVVLVEDYNMALARFLVQGVDIWLNNPRRPLEASGTSGQKVCINGNINFSILDGWWCEGYNGKNGWAIGDNTYYDDEYLQDNADSQSLYEILENEIIPQYYFRNEEGIPVKWIPVMKESIRSLAYNFSTHRMVQDYTNKMYIPSMNRMDQMTSSSYDLARSLSEWKSFAERSWSQVKILTDSSQSFPKDWRISAGEDLTVAISVSLGEISPGNVKVQVYYGRLDANDHIDNPQVEDMTLVESQDSGICNYSAHLKILEGGEYGYTFRILPYHPQAINVFEPGLVRWAIQ